MKKQKGINCLPIFLTGCLRLLIVAGPTYCSRLWCVMEIFTFMRMGGTRERIEVKMLMHKDLTDPAAAKKVLKRQFATFDAAKAKCFMQADRQRLLAVIEAGFGDFKEFNKDVRSIFAKRLRRRSISASRRSLRLLPSQQTAVRPMVCGDAIAGERSLYDEQVSP